MKKIIISLSGPSGAGKDTIAEYLLKQKSDIHKVVYFTTRSPRENEIPGKTAIFLSNSEFEELIKINYFAEYNFYDGCYYGTPISELSKNSENDILIIPSLSGAKKIKELFADTCTVFIVPPSYEEWINRLGVRSKNRIEIAKQEFTIAKEICDYFIVNDDIVNSMEQLEKIIEVHRNNIIAKIFNEKFIDLAKESKK